MHSGRLSTTGLPIGPEMKTHVLPHGRAADLPITSGPVVARSNTARLDRRQSAKHMHMPGNQTSSKYFHRDIADSSKQEWTHHLLDGPSASHRKDDRTGDKESTIGATWKRCSKSMSNKSSRLCAEHATTKPSPGTMETELSSKPYCALAETAGQITRRLRTYVFFLSQGRTRLDQVVKHMIAKALCVKI
ncbi:hypothetical protein B296_00022538 [Ensete ventricosum]|uniref:Uncharacterized protein n=1 Tax=Ensete ventricosum TaxID=4639 RepID=A0A426Z865_ENSVE|nr:hypothetical protein B296_00022538 [Ensete ventricosum]